MRDIDDIFLTRKGKKEEFEVFVQKINNCHPTTKFEHHISKNEINFLNRTVLKVSNQHRTKFYTKPIYKQCYLHRKSKHPHSMKNSIAYNQVLRFNEIHYNKRDLEKNCLKLLKALTNRGYNKTKTTSHINKAIAITRNEILNRNPA